MRAVGAPPPCPTATLASHICRNPPSKGKSNGPPRVSWNPNRQLDRRGVGQPLDRLRDVQRAHGLVLPPEGRASAGTRATRSTGTPIVRSVPRRRSVPGIRPQEPRIRLLGRRERRRPPLGRLHRRRADRHPGTDAAQCINRASGRGCRAVRSTGSQLSA